MNKIYIIWLTLLNIFCTTNIIYNMKRRITIFIFLLQIIPAFSQNHSITGFIKDSETNEPIAYCNIILFKTTKGTTTDNNGKFKIDIPINYLSKLVVTYIGYKTDTLQVVDGKSEYIIYLYALQSVLNEVVVTGVAKTTFIRESPVSIISVPSKMLERSSESNIIDALVTNAPGLNAVKTGPNISKPYIRGLGYNRVLTLYDGIRQEGQQWGEEHGMEVDDYNIGKAEVIKGPASLMYGSDALAGVVSLLPSVPFDKDSLIQGKILSEYQSNNGLIGTGLKIGYSGRHWMWYMSSSFRLAKNYTNSIDGRVYNTGFQEKNFTATIGHLSKNGYTHLNLTLYDNLQGIPDGSRDSVTRRFTRQAVEIPFDDIKNRPFVTDAELNSYTLSPLHQHIQHYRLYTNNHYQIGQGDIDALFAFQQNIRREYNHPTVPEQPGMYVQLNTINYGLRYDAPKFLNLEVSLGVNGMFQNNKNKDATDFPIPDYNLFDMGTYVYIKWKYLKWTMSGGLRYDFRDLKGDNFYVTSNPQNGFDRHVVLNDTASARMQFPAFRHSFSGISMSAGATYMLTEKISIKANIARAFRAPSISEIASNGLDPGAHIVYIGNKNFVPEFSLQEDIGISTYLEDISANLSIFNNNVQNYIYLAQMVDADGDPVVLVTGNKTLQFQQASAQLYGMEVTLDFHPEILKGFSINNNVAMVYGFNRKKEYKNNGVDGEYLPLIPPLKIFSSINQDIKTKGKVLSAIFMKVEIDYNTAQNRYLALYNTETYTPSSVLINISGGVDINYTKKHAMLIQLQVNNLFNTASQSNLSRLKYFEYYSQLPGGHSGIYNMGRNICVKLIVPF
jgi:iron complex outermembrane recepter protein